MFLERKKIVQVLLLIVVTATFWAACKKSKDTTTTITDGNATVTYTESVEDFANPERGFFRFTEVRASAYVPLVQSQLQLWRGLTTANSGNYQVYSTLVYRNFIMDVFKNAPLSAAFLQAVKNDFDIARAAGVKLIPRFVYTNTVTAGSCPEQWICAPYGDAPKSIVLQHLAQLKPILTDAADVIAVVQMGFIGVWGENYYTDHFGDASQNGQGKLLDNNWLDRNAVIAALLDAVPKDRMIQVRLPQMKQRFVYGVNATVNNALAITESEAFSGLDKARIGFHNDCFLAGTDDYGTYEDMGNSSTPRQSANTVLRNFTKADSKYVAVGGETCDDTYSPQNDCEPAGMAETEMAAYHYSFLNCAYNNAVNNDWQTNGCMLNIRKKLGYRFVLKEMGYPKEIKSGSSLPLSLTVNNIGYASPFNERPVKLILKNSGTGQEIIYALNTDIRKWFSGTTKIETSVTTDASLTAGVYDMYLFMPDKYASIAAKPEYAIQLANTGVWDAATGYNKLLAKLKVN
ncbi:DUF4832 domain-containing protein [Ferruginibacter sp.]|nr:DUF4832 domain-containing protein [Ferruginibacter sp.]